MEETVIDIGNTVICDWCNLDYTESDVEGGVLYVSKACCPDCVPEVERLYKADVVVAYEQGESVRSLVYCPSGTKFREWVLQLRGGDNTIRIVSG